MEKKITAWIADLIIRRRWYVVAVFGLLTIAGVMLSGTLDVVIEPGDLLSEDNLTAQRFFEVSDQFGSTTSLVVTVEGTDRSTMIAAAHAVVDRVRADQELSSRFRAINLRREVDYPLTWGLMLADDPQDVRDIQKMLEQRTLLGFLTSLNDRIESVVTNDDEFSTNQDEWNGLSMLAGLERLALVLQNSLTAEDPSVSADSAELWAQEVIESVFLGDQYSWSPDQDMLMLSFFPSFADTDIEAIYYSVESIYGIIDEVEQEFAGVSIRQGGEIPWVYARHQGVGSDTMVPTLFALIFIAILFFFSFTSLRKIMMAILVLVIGIIITTGAIALTIGHISLITSIFAVILLGLGIDFGIHWVSNYDDFRLRGMEPKEAIRHTMIAGGTPIMLGGITTACAFFALALSSAPTVSEFGFVAGMGVLITLFTMLTLLPALIVIFGGKGELKKRAWRPMINFNFMAGIGRHIQNHPYIAIVAAILLTALSLFVIPLNEVDYDPMNNSPRTHPVTQTQRVIMEKMKISPFVSLAMHGCVEELRDFSDQFRQNRYVSRVSSVADMLPPQAQIQQRLQLIKAGGSAGPNGANDISGLSWSKGVVTERTAADVERLLEEIQRLEWNVIEIGDLAVAGLGENNMIVARRDAMIREIIGAEVGTRGREVFQTAMDAIAANPQKGAVHLGYLDAAFAQAVEKQQARMTVDRAPTIDDLPQDMREQFVSQNGEFFLATIIATSETQLSNESILEYHNAMVSIDPSITGSVPVYVAFIEEIFTEAAKAGIYVAIAVFVLLFVIFKNFGFVLMAFGMVVLGILWMFGLLPLTGTQLALTAGMVFPLLIGIGTDDALHILHRYKHENGDIAKTLRYSGKAVLLTTVTTMLGFGSLAVVGEMATIAAIGWLLFVGIGTCFLSTVIVLPAVLSLINKRKMSKKEITNGYL